jgi:alpha-L-fucosidase 2
MADDWEHGLVAGTGSIGAVLFGTPERHAIHVCHEEFFLPVNSAKPAPLIAPGLADVRAAALAGDTDAAAAIADRLAREDGYGGTFIWTDPFTPVAELSWTPDGAGQAIDYRRTGDFETGRVEVGWSDADGSSTRIALVPDRASNGMAVQLVSEAERSGVLGLSLGDDASGADNPFAKDYGAFLMPARPEISGRTMALDARIDEAALPPFVQKNPPSPWGPRHVRILVDLPDHVSFEAVDGGVRLHLRAGQLVQLPIRIELDGGLAQATAPDGTRFDGTTHASLFDASSLDLHSGIDDAVSYDEVLERARAGDAQAVLSAVELAFAAGRHTIISSTGVLPPNLVGIWQGTRRPRWSRRELPSSSPRICAPSSVTSTTTRRMPSAYSERRDGCCPRDSARTATATTSPRIIRTSSGSPGAPGCSGWRGTSLP